MIPKIKTIPISEIHKNPDNPRVIKDENFKKLVESIRSFPEMMSIRPIVIDSTGMILGGNMRFEACKVLKIQEVPVLFADNLTDAQKKEFIIKDNLPGGEWDWDKLANEWDKDFLEQWGVTGLKGSIDLNDELNDEIQNEHLICPKCGFEWHK